MKKRNTVFNYLLWSSLLAGVVLIASIISFMVYDMTKIPQAMEQIVSRYDAMNLDEAFYPNLDFVYTDSSNGYKYHHQSIKPNMQGYHELVAELTYSDLLVETYEGDEVVLEINSHDRDLFRISYSNSKIILEEKERFKSCLFFCDNVEKSSVSIKVPKEIIDFDLSSVNGSLVIHATGNELDAAIVNGSIALPNSTFETVEFETMNGKVYVTDSIVKENVDITTVNGNIYIQGLEVDTLVTDSINSDLFMNEIIGNHLAVNLVNGDLDFKEVYFPHIAIENTNGYLTLVNEDESYQIQELSLKGMKQNHKIAANVLNFTLN